jgi:hypothetical protein
MSRKFILHDVEATDFLYVHNEKLWIYKTRYCGWQNWVQIKSCRYLKCAVGKIMVGKDCCIRLTFRNKLIRMLKVFHPESEYCDCIVYWNVEKSSTFCMVYSQKPDIYISEVDLILSTVGSWAMDWRTLLYCLSINHNSYILTVVGGDTQKDDIHLILEYKANEEWGIYTSPRANRYSSSVWYCLLKSL